MRCECFNSTLLGHSPFWAYLTLKRLAVKVGLCASYSPAHALCKVPAEEKFNKPAHLLDESRAIAVPPEFLHAGHAVRVNVLGPHHFFQAEASVSAADAAGFLASVRSFADAEAGNEVIDHHGPGVDAARQSLTAMTVARPHAGREAELGIVGQRDGLVFAFERANGKHGSESLFTHDGHGVSDVGEDGGSKKILAEFLHRFAAGKQAGTAGQRVIHVALHRPQLAVMDHGTHVRGGVGSRAKAKFGRLGYAGFEKVLVERFVHVASNRSTRTFSKPA